MRDRHGNGLANGVTGLEEKEEKPETVSKYKPWSESVFYVLPTTKITSREGF
jgi:hypothetical protein